VKHVVKYPFSRVEDKTLGEISGEKHFRWEPGVQLEQYGPDGGSISAWCNREGAMVLNEVCRHKPGIDGIVEPRRSDGGQEARLQEVVDQVLAGRGHRRFFCREKPLDLESGPR
jgi:hypothetical protein